MHSERPLTSQFVMILADFAFHEAAAPFWSCHLSPSQVTASKTA